VKALYCERLLAPRPTPKLKVYTLSVVKEFLIWMDWLRIVFSGGFVTSGDEPFGSTYQLGIEISGKFWNYEQMTINCTLQEK